MGGRRRKENQVGVVFPSFLISSRVFDIATGKLEKELTGHTGTILAMTSINGKVFSGGEDKKIKVWDAEVT